MPNLAADERRYTPIAAVNTVRKLNTEVHAASSGGAGQFSGAFVNFMVLALLPFLAVHFSASALIGVYRRLI